MSPLSQNKILYYNNFQIFNHIKKLRDIGIIFDNYSDNYIEKFKPENNLFRSKQHAIIDRNGDLEHFLPISYKHPSPIFDLNFKKSFKEVCEERATNLIKTYKRLNIFWSGGIDSTLVLFMLMSKTNNFSQIRVICTTDSLVESGSMFDKLIKHRVSYILTNKVSSKYFFNNHKFNSDEDLFICGSLADQLTNNVNIINTNNFNENTLSEPYEKHIDESYLKFLDTSIQKYTIKIKTLHDFLWFYKFIFSWHSLKYFKNIAANMPLEMFQSFYDTEDFQQWAINYSKSNLPFKQHAKDLIYELTGDKLYSLYKMKGTSSARFVETDWLFILDNGKTVNYQEIYNGFK